MSPHTNPEPITDEASEVDPTRSRLSWVPVATGTVLAVVLTGTWRQLLHPYLAHDDWYFLLRVDKIRQDQIFDRLLWEGRWLNFAWWRGIGHLLTPVTAVLLFTTLTVLLASRIAWRWAPGWLGVPAVVALFASPMLTDISAWPATLVPALLVAVVATWSLQRCAENRWTLARWIFLSTVLGFLTYPPVAVLLFVVLVVELIDRPLRDLILATLAFGASYAVGTLTAFTLNLIVFGTFGLDLPPWRLPNQVHSISDLGENLGRSWRQVLEVVDYATIPLALGLAALVTCVLLPATRTRGLRLALLLVVALGIQSSTTVLSGVSTPIRSWPWLWVLAVVPILWLAAGRGVQRRLQLGALMALALTAGWGLRYANDLNAHQQHELAAYDRVDHRLTTMLRERPGDPVFFVGSEEDWADYDFKRQAQYLSLRAFDEHGVTIEYCRTPECHMGQWPAVASRIARGMRVIQAGRYILVVPPAHLRQPTGPGASVPRQ